jgi:hypothetical protein
VIWGSFLQFSNYFSSIGLPITNHFSPLTSHGRASGRLSSCAQPGTDKRRWNGKTPCAGRRYRRMPVRAPWENEQVLNARP